ncbi:MAG: PQ-loop repeat-containing protein [Deltaproteobacteria bacterium]|nr:PQ-loop repeat-containing protein [Deltaproteobacteria bacterium]
MTVGNLVLRLPQIRKNFRRRNMCLGEIKWH